MPQYTELLEDARRHAIDRMVANAKLLGANAIVSMRFDSSEMGNGLTRSWPTGPPSSSTVPADDELAALVGRHYAAGRFDGDELERRLDLALAGSHDALDGLPPLPAAAPKRRWGRRPGNPARRSRRWVPTKERFVDPTTQRVMRVWIDPADHARHYVAD